MNSRGEWNPSTTTIPQDQVLLESDLRLYSTTTNYYGTVNNIGHAENTNFGVNYGSIISEVGLQDILSPMASSEAVRPIPDASHTRNRRTSPPDSICLPGTRTKTIQRILSWSEGAARSPSEAHESRRTHIMWLCGPVGCGKSAIAQSVAEMVERRRCLAASFFFFRGSGSRGKFGRFALTLAAQISVAIPETKPYINAALRDGAGLPGASVAVQLERLVYRPIEAAASLPHEPTPRPASYLIVLDGLDECGDREDVEDFLEHMLAFFEEHPSIPLHFLISSRIEEHIRERIDSTQVEVVDLNDHGADSDIRVLVYHTFDVASKRNRVLRSLGYLWPDEDEVEELIEHADGSFIFVRTLLNHILGLSTSRDDGLTPMDRFTHALGMHPGLDGMYSETLQRAQHTPHFMVVVFTIALLYSPLSISDISQLLDLPTYRVVAVLIPLQAIVRVPGADGGDPVTLFHTSLRDFLLDEQRSADFFPMEWRAQHKDWIAHRCVELQVKYGAASLHYAVAHWREHWAAMAAGHEAFSHQVNWIFELGHTLVQETYFSTILSTFYLSLEASLGLYHHFLHHPRLDISPFLPPVTPQDHSLLEALTFLAHRYPRLLLLELKTRLRAAPWATPDASLHRQMIIQSMRCVTGNHEQYIDPTSPITSHLWAHILLFWIYHLRHCAEGLNSKELLDLLEERYPVAVRPDGWTLQVLPALSQVIRLDRRILKGGLSLLYAVITVTVAPIRQLPSLRAGANAVGALGRTYTHVTVLDMIYIFQRSLLGDSYFPPQLALITWRGALEFWGPNVGPDEVAEDGGGLATEARETVNEALLKFTILLDFTTPLQIPKLHISKQTALRLRSRAAPSIREVVVRTEDTKPARAYERPPTPGSSRPPILPTIEEIFQPSCPCSSPEATTTSPATSDEDRARERRAGKQRCVCVGLEGP